MRSILSLVVLLLWSTSPLALAGEGVREINQSSVAGNFNTLHIISAPGSYRLTGDLVAPAGKSGILISADDVTLDFNGFTLSSQSVAGQIVRGIEGGGHSNIEIKSGTIRAFRSAGVYMPAGQNHRILDMRVIENGIGINLEGLGGDGGSIVRDCLAASNTLEGIRVLGAGSLVLNNVARANTGGGIIMANDNGYALNVATGNVGAGDVTGGNAIGCNRIGGANVCPP